jgi:hypothetical protein
MEPLDNILSGREAASGQTEQPALQQDTTTQQQAAEAPQAKPDSEEPEALDVGGQKMVPQQALHASREKVKRYTEQVADFQRQLAEQNQAAERRMAQVLELVKQPQQQPQAPPDWFEDPNAAALHAVSPHMKQFESMLMANARLTAETRFTEEKVNAAEQAFMQAVQTQALDQADYQRVVNAPNRFAAAVQWHQRQEAQKEIGTDPAAYKAKVEAEIREKVLAELQQGGQPQATQQRAPGVMPSNLAAARNVGTRSVQPFAPRSIDDIFAKPPQPRS